MESALNNGATYISELKGKRDKKKEIKVEDGNDSKPIADANKSKRDTQEQIEKKSGAVFIPPHIKQVSWYERVVIWVGVLLLVAFGLLGVFLMFKLRRERFKKAQSIYKMIDKFPTLSPRERNILFNKINLFISIGSKEYWQNITLANMFKSVRIFVFNGFLFLLYLIVLPWDGRRTLKTRFQLAFRYAFEIFGNIKPQKHIEKDIKRIEKVLNGNKVRDSRFEVVGFEEIVGSKSSAKAMRYY